LADKEPSIRAQAVIALSRLNIVEDSHDIENGEKDIEDLLNEMLIYDDEACVQHEQCNSSLIPTQEKFGAQHSLIRRSIVPLSTFY